MEIFRFLPNETTTKNEPEKRFNFEPRDNGWVAIWWAIFEEKSRKEEMDMQTNEGTNDVIGHEEPRWFLDIAMMFCPFPESCPEPWIETFCPEPWKKSCFEVLFRQAP